MPSELLKCTICPKRPTFSDVSHLLTHIGSKGHLAHLHRLQVKSHQELNAAHSLAIYNQWFQEHGVAALLSERMQQKDQRRADKKAANEARLSTVYGKGRSRGRKSATAVQQPPAVSAYEPQPPVLKSRVSDEDFGDLDYTSVPASSIYPVFASSPPRMLPSQSVEDEKDCTAEEETPAKLSPGTPQLKGTRWPGMDMFDAAPDELKKKRNQRKDASVLRNLQRNAGRVEPTETVHSATGVALKRRHMDDLENDSPVEGETVIEKPTPKRRKTSAPRAKRQTKETKKPRGRPRKNFETPSKQPSSSIGDMVRSISRFSPTEDDSREFKLAIRSFGQKRKKGNFTIYQDSPPSFGGDGSSEMVAQPYVAAHAARPQLVYSTPPWQRPQVEAYDPFKLIRERFGGYPAFPDVGQGEENAPTIGMDVSPQGHASMNPLFSQAGMDRFGVGQSLSNQNRLNPIVAPSFDTFNDNEAFLPVRNPLAVALGGLDGSPTKRQGFGFDADTASFATQYRQPLFAP